MADRILTLFGEEIVPEQPRAPAKPRAKKNEDEVIEPAPVTEAKVPVQSGGGPQVAVEPAPELVPPPDMQEAPAPKLPRKKRELEEEMALPDNWTGDKQYYTIGEVAALFKVKTSHIRFWTNEFKLRVRTTRKGDRLFTAGQIRELKAIHHLVKERGFTLTGAKAKLKTQNKRDVETVDLKQSLLQLKKKLVVIRNQIK